MLRPATPLTVLLFAAFVLLLISVLSTPVIKQIPLATFGGVDFGVFGFCDGSTCSNIEIGYNTAGLFTAAETASFDLPTTTRTTLSAILIIHPIAAIFTLVMLILAASAHFHSPSHSPRFLLGIFILSILTLLLALLAFLIDVLLFVPHMAWGSYIVLAATILVAASGVVSCAMRRTLVSRKARKRRIAENAEMNGENFYNRQGTGPIPPVPPTGAPLANGAPGVDKLPSFATFEMAKKDGESDQVPLTSRTPTDRPPNNGPEEQMAAMNRNDNFGPQRGGSPSKDQFGNPIIPVPGAYGMRSRDPSRDPSLRREYSDNSINSRGRGGMPPGGYRGRGGYPGNFRGGYGPPRGGYGPPRGGYGPPNGRGGYGPSRGGYGPPGGMNDGMMGPMAMGAAGGMAAGAMRGGRGGPPPGYGQPQGGRGYDRGQSPNGSYGPYGRGPPPIALAPGYGMNQPQPGPSGYVAYSGETSRDSLPRAESPPPLMGETNTGPVGQAVEMDATTGSPSNPPTGFGTQFGNLRDSDGDVAGMVGLQQQRNLMQRETVTSETSRYSSDEPYVPPRQAWGDQGRMSPLNPNSQPAELPSSGEKRASSDHYYEDIEPRFAEQTPEILSALTPGYGSNGASNSNLQRSPSGGLDVNNPYEDVNGGNRSPAESDRSNFTSVSQRGVNPRWNGGPGGYNSSVPNRRPVAAQRNDLLLSSNPDFQLQGVPTGRGGRGGGRAPGTGMTTGGPYPSAGPV